VKLQGIVVLVLEDGDRHKEGRILQIHPSTRRFRTLFNGGSGLGREEKYGSP